MDVCDSECVEIADAIVDSPVPDVLANMAGAVVNLFANLPFMSWGELLALIEAKASARTSVF
jgi:hypothetical protein